MKEKIILLLVILLFSGAYNRLLAQDNEKTFKGYVYHQDGLPFENALINYIIGDKVKQTTTNSDGYYEISGYDNCKVTISFPDYYSKIVYPIEERTTKTYMIKTSSYSVERNFYGATQKNSLRTSPASITLIRPDEHYTQKETVDDQWRELSSGLYSSTQSGIPGAGSFNIMRGIHSLHTTVSPSIVLDGMYIGDYSFNDPVINGNTLYTILGINPANVEEIVFLKDGASSLEYGIRGGNGVILINTIHPTTELPV